MSAVDWIAGQIESMKYAAHLFSFAFGASLSVENFGV